MNRILRCPVCGWQFRFVIRGVRVVCRHGEQLGSHGEYRFGHDEIKLHNEAVVHERHEADRQKR